MESKADTGKTDLRKTRDQNAVLAYDVRLFVYP